MNQTKRIKYIHWYMRGDFFISNDVIGWDSNEIDNAIKCIGEPDPLKYYLKSNIDVGFYYKGHQYWIESPAENLRDHGGDIWSLSICDKPNPNWDGEYARFQYLGEEKHDASERTELCHYDGMEEFLAKTQIDGVPIREILNNSYISDL